MITCPDCGNALHLYDMLREQGGLYRFQLTGTCLDPSCELHSVALEVHSENGRSWLVPPRSNRGVTLPVNALGSVGE